MQIASKCPEAEVLERLALGQISAEETDALEAHVLQCDRCAARLKGLQLRDPLMDAMRAANSQPPIPPAADAMIPWLKHLRPIDAQATLPPSVDSQATVPPTIDLQATMPPANPASTEAPTRYPAAGTGGNPESTLPNYDFLGSPVHPDELGRLKNYSVLKTIGAGGMGMVFLAEDETLKRKVALKVIKPELLDRQELRDRFLAEARAVAAVKHDNIVDIYVADDADGIPYLVMPLLHGESLESYLNARSGPLPIGEILSFSKGIAAGLAAAHDRGMIHRDIKPSNVWLEAEEKKVAGDQESAASEKSPAGESKETNSALATDRRPRTTLRVKILDFGLSRSVESVDEDGQQRSILGTPAYMSPEQASCQPLDARTDLFSLGCVMYRMATGKMPFHGNDIVATLYAVATEEPSPPKELNPKLPADAARLIEKLLAKKVSDRCASAHEAVQEIERIERSLQPKKLIRWLAATAACVLLAVGATFAVVANLPPPPEVPGEVTFEFDEPDSDLVVQRGDDAAREFNVAAEPKQSLPPGAYVIRTKSRSERKLVPDHFTVDAGQAQAMPLRLVGLVRKLSGHAEYVTGVAFSPERKSALALSSSFDRSLVLWNTETETSVALHDELGKQTPTYCVAFSPDGKRAICGSGARGAESRRHPDNMVRVFDLEKRACTAMLAGHESQVSAVAVSPDGKTILSGDKGGFVIFWDAAKLEKKQAFDAHDRNEVHGLTFLKDGKQALSCGGDKLLLWDVEDPGRLKIFDHKSILGVSAAPDGKHAVTAGDDGIVRLWNLQAETFKVLLRNDCGINAVSFSPDGTRLLTGDRKGLVKLWRADSGELIESFSGHQGKQVAGVSFSGDGRRAISGGGLVVCLWELPR